MQPASETRSGADGAPSPQPDGSGLAALLAGLAAGRPEIDGAATKSKAEDGDAAPAAVPCGLTIPPPIAPVPVPAPVGVHPEPAAIVPVGTSAPARSGPAIPLPAAEPPLGGPPSGGPPAGAPVPAEPILVAAGTRGAPVSQADGVAPGTSTSPSPGTAASPSATAPQAAVTAALQVTAFASRIPEAPRVPAGRIDGGVDPDTATPQPASTGPAYRPVGPTDETPAPESAAAPAAPVDDAKPEAEPAAAGPAPGRTKPGLAQPGRSTFLATDRTGPDAPAPDGAASPDEAKAVAQDPEQQPRTAASAALPDGRAPDETPSSPGAPDSGLLATAKDAEPRAASPSGIDIRAAGPGPLVAPGLDRPLPAPASSPAASPIPLAAVPVEIGLRSLGGSSRFEIRLSPDDLGRIDVRLEIDGEKQVRAHLAVERPETLAFLTRDRAQLERVFEQAGLKPAEGGVAFSLQDGSGGRGGSGEAGREPTRAPLPALPEEASAQPAAILPTSAYAAGRGRAGIDLRV